MSSASTPSCVPSFRPMTHVRFFVPHWLYASVVLPRSSALSPCSMSGSDRASFSDLLCQNKWRLACVYLSVTGYWGFDGMVRQPTPASDPALALFIASTPTADIIPPHPRSSFSLVMPGHHLYGLDFSFLIIFF